ncbi:MAG: DUF1998 domain-containing protein [Magnetococcales bacterium]|nr:DUF1998 domain-containing protein [Magnetococcales bacterium]
MFLHVREEVLENWCWQPDIQKREKEFAEAHRQWCEMRGIDDPGKNFPGIRYLLLHTFSHALMRQLALSGGYAAASIRERIYARGPDEGDPMAGILLYTAAPDCEGTLGGLVSLGQPKVLGRIIMEGLEQMRLCASDPLCSEHHPFNEGVTLHGAACHACLFAPETSCERGNKYLDRTLLIQGFPKDWPPFFSGFES